MGGRNKSVTHGLRAAAAKQHACLRALQLSSCCRKPLDSGASGAVQGLEPAPNSKERNFDKVNACACRESVSEAVVSATLYLVRSLARSTS